MANGKMWTPAQEAILSVLSDGNYHTQKDVIQTVDEFMDANALGAAIFRIRRKLRTIGEDIITDRTNGQAKYRHVRIISIGE